MSWERAALSCSELDLTGNGSAGSPDHRSPAWSFPGERHFTCTEIVVCIRRSLPGSRCLPRIKMKFCHGEKHGNLQHSPQIHTCPPFLALVIASANAPPLLFGMALSFAASTSSPTPARSSFPSRHWEGSLFCVFHRAYALPGLGRSASIHVSPHICFQPGSPHSPQLFPWLLVPFVLLTQHLLHGASSNILC